MALWDEQGAEVCLSRSHLLPEQIALPVHAPPHDSSVLCVHVVTSTGAGSLARPRCLLSKSRRTVVRENLAPTTCCSAIQRSNRRIVALGTRTVSCMVRLLFIGVARSLVRSLLVVNCSISGLPPAIHRQARAVDPRCGLMRPRRPHPSPLVLVFVLCCPARYG